jgi:UDP-N-acetylmuramate dehydrogenase
VIKEVGFVNEEGVYRLYTREEMLFSYRRSSFQSLKGYIVSASFYLKKSEEARKRQLEIINYRTKTQPYGDKSAGCFFVNPPGKSAGAIIDSLGLKGKKIGGASVSKLHANFIINEGKATSKDILELASSVQEEVFKSTGEKLEMEVVSIPYENKHE